MKRRYAAQGYSISCTFVAMGVAEPEEEDWAVYDDAIFDDVDVVVDRTIPTDEEMQLRLCTLQTPLLIQLASSERNNCLIDSTLQALVDVGAIKTLGDGDRRLLHFAVRTELERQAFLFFKNDSFVVEKHISLRV